MTDSNTVNPQVPLKFKLYLTKEQRQAYRLAANLTKKESIADYIVHAINTYTAFLLAELKTQVEQTQAAQANQTASSEQVAPIVESGHDAQVNP